MGVVGFGSTSTARKRDMGAWWGCVRIGDISKMGEAMDLWGRWLATWDFSGAGLAIAGDSARKKGSTAIVQRGVDLMETKSYQKHMA